MAQIREKAGDQQGAGAYRAELTAIQSSRTAANETSGINEDIASAQALLSQGHLDQAWSKIESALSRIDSEGLRNIGYLGQIVNLSGAFAEKNGELADQFIERVQTIQDRKLPAAHPLYNPWLIANYDRHGDQASIARIWSKYFLAIESANGPDSPRLVDPLNQIANVLQAQEGGRPAITAVRRVLTIQERTSGENSEAVIQTLTWLGSMYFGLGNPSAAMEAYEREISMSRRFYGASRNHAINLSKTAQSFSQWRQFDRAMELANEALDIMSKPEHASELEFFRGIMATIEKQKAAFEAQTADSAR
jgi:tetratricopeptide (TPR) repeat protein